MGNRPPQKVARAAGHKGDKFVGTAMIETGMNGLLELDKLLKNKESHFGGQKQSFFQKRS